MTTVVVGLDGAGFELLDPWLADGSLSTLTRLVETGAATDMQSCLPPVTCPNWQCYATGTNPGKLGVFWWERIDAGERSIETTSRSDQFDGTHYWTYLPGEAAVVNLPTSYPPPDIDGVHIAGGPGAEGTGYTSPPEFEQRLERDHAYGVHPRNMDGLSTTSPDANAVQEVYDLIDLRFDVLEELLSEDRFSFVHVTVFYINVLQHFYWDHEVVRRAWKRIDSRLGDLLDRDNVERLFVVSDHGSNEIEVTFNINEWLRREGYLVTDTGVNDLLHRVGLTRDRVRGTLSRLGVERRLRQVVPRRIQTLLPDESGSVTESAKARLVDWDASTALASGQGPVYVLAEDPRERQRIRASLVEDLDGLTHRGKQVVASAVPAVDIYEGPHLGRGPDVLLRQEPGVHIKDSLGGDRGPFEQPDHWRGENKQTGLFVAHGPDVNPDAPLTEMTILDVAPTVIHRHGMAVPENMDGTARTDLYRAESDPAERPVQTREPSKSTATGTRVESEAADRLRSLGYRR